MSATSSDTLSISSENDVIIGSLNISNTSSFLTPLLSIPVPLSICFSNVFKHVWSTVAFDNLDLISSVFEPTPLARWWRTDEMNFPWASSTIDL